MDLLNDIILSILKNFAPDEFITCDDRDPTRIKDNIKIKSTGKNSMQENCKRKDKKTEHYELLTKAISEVSKLIEKSKDEYYYCSGKQLYYLSTSAKSYRTILKTFL